MFNYVCCVLVMCGGNLKFGTYVTLLQKSDMDGQHGKQWGGAWTRL
jgi:hypothetical protein